MDEDGDSLGINLELLSAVAGVLGAIMSGNREAMEVFVEHCPLVMDEEELSEIADESEQGDDEYEEEEEEEDDDEYEGDDDARVDDSYEPSEDDEREFQGVREMVDDELADD